jgi:hypothetical protein
MSAIRRDIKDIRAHRLPDVYRDLLQLHESEPAAARELSRSLRRAIHFYARLLAHLEESSPSDAQTELSKVCVLQARLENQIDKGKLRNASNGAISGAVEAKLPEYSRKRALLRKCEILRLLASPNAPLSSSEIASAVISKGLANNEPTVTTHLWRMKRDGFIEALTSGVFRLSQAGHQELQKEQRRLQKVTLGDRRA